MKRHEENILCSCADNLGIDLTPSQVSLLGIYLDELWEWNKKFNLVWLASRESIIKELVVDSLVQASFLPIRGRMLDVGSGAGLPAIPFLIYRVR